MWSLCTPGEPGRQDLLKGNFLVNFGLESPRIPRTGTDTSWSHRVPAGQRAPAVSAESTSRTVTATAATMNQTAGARPARDLRAGLCRAQSAGRQSGTHPGRARQTIEPARYGLSPPLTTSSWPGSSRGPDPADRRVRLLSITEVGRQTRLAAQTEIQPTRTVSAPGSRPPTGRSSCARPRCFPRCRLKRSPSPAGRAARRSSTREETRPTTQNRLICVRLYAQFTADGIRAESAGRRRPAAQQHANSSLSVMAAKSTGPSSGRS